MDGARLWEVVAAYGRSEKEIAEGFNSVYVSLYKGMHGMGGAMLLGKTNFIAEARRWTSRYGGSVYHRTPYVVSAAMQFDSRITAMPDCYRRTVWLYEVLKDYPLIVPNPSVAQANMLHLHMPVSRERAIHIRNRIAAQHGVWLFGGVRHAALPNHCSIELYVGDNLVNMPDQRLREILNLWCDKLTEEAETDFTYVNADI
jgi:threonine aldolase